MKNKEVLELSTQLEPVAEQYSGLLAFNVLKNINNIQEHLRLFNKSLPSLSDSALKYEGERISLCIKHSEKNSEGQPILVNNNFSIIDIDSFNVEFKLLSDKYVDAIKEIEERSQKVLNFLEEEFPVGKLIMLPESLIEAGVKNATSLAIKPLLKLLKE